MPELRYAERFGVVGPALMHCICRCHADALRGVEIRLAHLQVDDVPAGSGKGVCLFHNIHDQKRRYGLGGAGWIHGVPIADLYAKAYCFDLFRIP